MKKVLSIVLTFILGLTFSTTALAANTHLPSGKLTARELTIGKAYLNTLETFNSKYLNAVKYPGVTFESDSLDEGVTIKVLNPVFSKEKDAALKLDRIDVSGLLVVSSADKLSLANITQGMAIKVAKKKLYAFQEVDVKINTVAAISDLNETLRGKLTAHLTDLYGAEVAKALISDYTVDSAEGDDSSDSSDGGSSDEGDVTVTPTPTAPR